MVKQSHILLLGDSVFMDSIAENLLAKKSYNVVRINSNTQEIKTFLKTINPDLIIYELHEENADLIFTIISEQENTFHLAIDLNAKQTILLHCRRQPTGSMQELCELVNQELNSENIKEEVE